MEYGESEPEESMTEDEWLGFDDPRILPYSFLKQFSDRKFRLCAVAACRTVAHLLCDAGRASLEVAERMAEGLAERAEWEAAAAVVHARIPRGKLTAYGAVSWAFALYPASQVMQMACENAIAAGGLPSVQYAELLRDIIGNPFRSSDLTPAIFHWNNGTVVKLAQGIYDDRAFNRLPILADALEAAGCNDADILGHCRHEGPHVRGCWVVDLLIGRT